MRSFCEGVVSRVDVITPEGRFFVVEVTHEIILDREHRILRGFQDFVRYECRNDFPGRIEILSPPEQDVATNSVSDPVVMERSEVPQHEVAGHHSNELDVYSEPEPEQRLEADTNSEPAPLGVEPQPIRKRGGLLAALFGRTR
jgi:hypothetical protein